MSEIQCTIDERIDHINMLTQAVKESFFEIAKQMKAIKDECGLKQKEYLALMEERTGYKKSAIGQFLRANRAMGNLIDFCPDQKAAIAVFPDNESQVRPLATKALNEDPEGQAAIWTEVVEEAGDEPITAKMVKDKVKAKLNPEPPKPPAPPMEVDTFTPEEKDVAKEMVNVVRRSLSKKYHPDAGGDPTKMATLNKLLDYMERSFELDINL